MGKLKALPGTPKDICNRQKARQLQKLKWYCQMCQKSCRDANGFKCHISSESHQRQLLLFAEDPDKFVEGYSKEFLEGYMSLLRRQYSSKRVLANDVYVEYISNRHHMHMNATCWETLTQFVHHLAKRRLIKAEDSEKGWYITYIDRDPWLQEKERKRREAKHDLEREREAIERQVAEGRTKTTDPTYKHRHAHPSRLKRRQGEEKIQLELVKKKRSMDDAVGLRQQKVTIVEDEAVRKAFKLNKKIKDREEAEVSMKEVNDKMTALEAKVMSGDNVSNTDDLRVQLAKLESLIAKEKSKALSRGNEINGEDASVDDVATNDDSDTDEEEDFRNEQWILSGIVVKIVTKKLGDKFYKQKGFVRSIDTDKFTAVVQLLNSGSKVRLDQSFLQTVIPAVGGRVLVLNGRRRGEEGVLSAIDRDNFCGSVSLGDDPRETFQLPYDDFSKLHQPSK